MDQAVIFAPMGALACLTFCVLGMLPLRRIQAARQGLVRPADFRLGESQAVPPFAVVVNRNYMNLLELPLLFYVVCIMYYVAHRVDGAVMTVAWAFVLLRLAHSAIHLSYNRVMHRLGAFSASNFALGLLWVMFFV